MIQRIQSLYLLIVTILMAVVFFMLPAAPVEKPVAALVALLPLITIFLYKRRRLQIKFCIAEIIVLLGVVVLTAIDIYGISESLWPLPWRPAVAAISIILSLVFTILAARAIARDEKLVRSLDRLR